MTVMTEPTENSVIDGADEPQEFLTASAKDDIPLLEDLDNTLEMSQAGFRVTPQKTGGPAERAAPEESDGRDDPQSDGPPAAHSSSAEPQWEAGAECRAVWSEDGLVYPAAVVSLDGDRCRVRFHGYGNEEDVELSSLKSPSTALQTQDWRPGSRCRAVYSEDGLVYPAVVLWVKGRRCRVRFDSYNNEEDQDVSDLLTPDELHGPNRAAPKGSGWRSSSAGGGSEGKWRRRREESQGERGGERRAAWRDDQQNWSKVEREAEEKKKRQQRDEAEKPTNHSSHFPPFPHPPQSGSGDPLSFIPPPPPLWMFGGKDSTSCPSVDATSSVLMLWYMCGFHTGVYMAQQLLRSTSKD